MYVVNKMYVVIYQDAYKPIRCNVLGVYESKEKAIELLLAFLTDNHNYKECDCELCEEYENMKKDLYEKGTTFEEYSIHEIELNKDF